MRADKLDLLRAEIRVDIPQIQFKRHDSARFIGTACSAMKWRSRTALFSVSA